MQPKNVIWTVANNACFVSEGNIGLTGNENWPYGQNNRPENVNLNHVTWTTQHPLLTTTPHQHAWTDLTFTRRIFRYGSNAKINEETEEKKTEEEEEDVCGCRHFRPMPRGMRGRRKDRLSEYVGFYDSLLEKPEMWVEGVTFLNCLGKDVWGIVQRYLRQDLVWFHIIVKHDIFDTFRKLMEKIQDP
ncbi:uncharacterized protein TNCV_218811 [Trichonephila clavipes]|uniref:Uncharacterized protein n=1 Tax=Trichonephila clavipes TaxID=2585209 RepID=A0A8X6VFI0_TRICX|nr:uncharacterized protein TNCV_218811 [Trichonephila clavipes]